RGLDRPGVRRPRRAGAAVSRRRDGRRAMPGLVLLRLDGAPRLRPARGPGTDPPQHDQEYHYIQHALSSRASPVPAGPHVPPAVAGPAAGRGRPGAATDGGLLKEAGASGRRHAPSASRPGREYFQPGTDKPAANAPPKIKGPTS